MRAAYCPSRVALLAASAVVAAGCATPGPGALPPRVADTVITSQVRAALVDDEVVAPLNIAVATVQGTVQLSGFASSHAEISRAVQLASDVRGVRSVKNDIRLVPPR